MKTHWGDGSYADSGILSTPLSFLHSGYLGWEVADLYARGVHSNYWTLRSESATFSSILYSNNISLVPQTRAYQGNGDAVRCVATLQILHHSH